MGKLIVNAKYGQLSNRLILTAHAISTAISRGDDIFLTEFDDLAPFYNCHFMSYGGEVQIHHSLLWTAEAYFDRYINLFFSKLLRRQRVLDFSPKIVSSWNYRDYENVEKYSSDIREFFQPKEEYLDNAKNLSSEIWGGRENLFVGVHIRRGDYKNWQGGKFYFDDTVYNHVLHNIEDIFEEKEICFILFSNETVALQNFDVNSRIVCSKGSAIEDHWLMSKCDYLVGPPSTFTRWAAYMGRKPLAYIESNEQEFTKASFKYISI